jgi:UDPglucose 6-dehydrogenase
LLYAGHLSRCNGSEVTRFGHNLASVRQNAAVCKEGQESAVRGKTVALLGLTFKPNTDDMREAPSLTIIQALLDAGAHVRAYDPKGMEQARAYFPEVEYADDPYGCAHEADALVILTEWEAFRALQLDRLRQMLKTPVLIDLRNVYSPEEVVRSGMSYVSVGRAAQPAPVAAASKRAVA